MWCIINKLQLVPGVGHSVREGPSWDTPLFAGTHIPRRTSRKLSKNKVVPDMLPETMPHKQRHIHAELLAMGLRLQSRLNIQDQIWPGGHQLDDLPDWGQIDHKRSQVKILGPSLKHLSLSLSVIFLPTYQLRLEWIVNWPCQSLTTLPTLCSTPSSSQR